MLSIGNKKYRNLQEQVGYNTEQIEKIFQTLDGLNIQDNVVVVPDMSYILDEDELAIVNKEVAFIVYDGHLYIKRSQDASTAYFDVVFSIQLSTVISFESSEIQVTLSNGGLGIVNLTVNSYSVTQVDDLLALKADISYVDTQIATCAKLSGASFTGAITAPSIIEDMSGYSFTVRTPSTFALLYNYVGVCKNGNKVTIIMSCLITPTVGSSGFQEIGRINMPADVLAKIIPAPAPVQDSIDIKSVEAFNSVTSSSQIKFRTTKGSGYLAVATHPSGLTNGTTYFARYEATFLLNDSLAS